MIENIVYRNLINFLQINSLKVDFKNCNKQKK